MCRVCAAQYPDGGDCSCGRWFSTWVEWSEHAQDDRDSCSAPKWVPRSTGDLLDVIEAGDWSGWQAFD